LPAPFAPINPTISPDGIVKEILFTAVINEYFPVPKFLDTSSALERFFTLYVFVKFFTSMPIFVAPPTSF
jgi:hypothetical protein